jgi:glycosyltransferase involved in cell wall biosynthesis
MMPDSDPPCLTHPTLCFLSYNRPALLDRAVTTALAYADRPVEVIIHDDGSTDEIVLPLIAQLQARGLVSTYIANAPGHNEGQGVALNRMFGMATGDVIFKLDQDLVFNPNWLRRALGILERNWFVHNEDGSEPLIGLLGLLHYHHDPVDTRKMLLDRYFDWESHHQILGSGFAVPRLSWRQFGPFEERSAAFAEDNVFQLDVTETDGWACALPNEQRNLVENDSMGPGPSTIVSHDGAGGIKVTPIQDGPKLIDPCMLNLARR